MTYTFKSQATGDLLMLTKPAQQILELVGKDPSKPGIIDVHEIAGAITALQKAIDAEKNRAKAMPKANEAAQADMQEANIPISLEQRAWPFIEMLKAAQSAGKPVVWGV